MANISFDIIKEVGVLSRRSAEYVGFQQAEMKTGKD